MIEQDQTQHEAWGSRLGVILAVAGSAVGLGNFLRFPGIASQNGGGAFMVPYFIALLLLGIPACWVEWTMGRYGGCRGMHSCPGIMGLVGRGRIARYLGVIGIVIPLVVYMYYVIIESWCLRYAAEYLLGQIDLGTSPQEYSAASKAHFVEVTCMNADGFIFGGSLHLSVLFAVGVCALNAVLVYRGISAGIEKFCNLAMPTMAFCAVIVLVRVLTLGTPDPMHPELSVSNGLGFMWNPDLSKLSDFSTWLAAAGQIFFSLSVGFGVIINYASYLKRKDDIVLSGLTASATNELFEVGAGGMITIPAAFVFLGASGAVGGTFGLGFNTLPVVFQYMGPFGRIVGMVWFFMLFLAAITSSLSMLQPVKAFFAEALGLSKLTSVSLLMIFAGIGSAWVLYFSKDLTALDTLDFWAGTFLILALATVQIISFGWRLGIEQGMQEAHAGALIRIPTLFRFIIKYVAPAYLLIIFAGFSYNNLPEYLHGLQTNTVARHTLFFLAAVVGLLIYFVRRGEPHWNAMESTLAKTPPLATPKEEMP